MSAPSSSSSSSASAASSTSAASAAADDDDSVAVGDFFAAASRRFVTRSYAFDGLEQPQLLDCSEAASTDFDQTGQIVWPSARLLAHFLVRRLGRARLAGEDVLELGAGCGLSGLVASRLGARSVTLTDNEPEVLDILRLNLRHAAPGVVARAEDLDWGRDAAHERLAAACGRARWSAIIAADVCYWRESIRPLFASVAALLDRADPRARFFLGYFDRAPQNRALLEAAGREQGLAFERLPAAELLGEPPPEDLALHRELMCVYTFRWAGEEGAAPEVGGAAAAAAPEVGGAAAAAATEVGGAGVSA